MDLNQVQLLVYKDNTLDHFRDAHDILDDLRIERPRLNEDAKLVKGNENRILVSTWFIHQAGLHFPISPPLKGSYFLVPTDLHIVFGEFCLDRTCGRHANAEGKIFLLARQTY